jgi:hypothetical protein
MEEGGDSETGGGEKLELEGGDSESGGGEEKLKLEEERIAETGGGEE